MHNNTAAGFLALVLAEAAHVLRLVGPLPPSAEDPLRAQRAVTDAAHALLTFMIAKGLDAGRELERGGS
jgi:cytochrome b561